MITRSIILNKAFTLLEMLVVIGIISIILAVTTVSFGAAQRQARDVKRREDMKALQNCMEQYNSLNNQYPPISISGPNNGTLTATCDNAAVPQVISVTDPLNSGNHVYIVNKGTPSSYQVTADLEQTNGGIDILVIIKNLQ